MSKEKDKNRIFILDLLGSFPILTPRVIQEKPST